MSDSTDINPAEHSFKLMGAEHATEEQRRSRLGAIAQEVEKIFLRESLTMGELSEVLDLFNARAHAVFSDMSIKSIKESYERRP